MALKCIAGGDAPAKQLVLMIMDESLGVQSAGTPSAVADLKDLNSPLDTSGNPVVITNKDARFRVLYFNDADNNCQRMKVAVWCTLPEPA